MGTDALLCCDNTKRKWDFNSAVCFALSLNMFSSLGNVKYYNNSLYFSNVCSSRFGFVVPTIVYKEDVNKSPQGEVIVFIGRSVENSSCIVTITK